MIFNFSHNLENLNRQTITSYRSIIHGLFYQNNKKIIKEMLRFTFHMYNIRIYIFLYFADFWHFCSQLLSLLYASI